MFYQLIEYLNLYLFLGDEGLHKVLRFLVAAELFQNIELYADHPKFLEGMEETKFTEETVYSSAFSNSSYQLVINEKNSSAAVQVEASLTCVLGRYGTLMQLFGLTSVLRRPIYSVYPKANLYL